MTKIYANFVISPVGLDACSTIDLTKYSYKLQFCEANGQQKILRAESEANFMKGGESRFHCFEYDENKIETPLAKCDIYCNGVATDKNIFVRVFFDNNSSNKWTVFKKKFSEGVLTNKSNFDKICHISKRRVFVDSQFPVGHILDPFEKSKIERQLKARLSNMLSPNDYMNTPYPDQKQSSLCGPATFLYALLKDNPYLYCQYVKDLWNNGEAMLGTMKINPSYGCCHPVKYTKHSGETLVPAIDWISMASLRDHENLTLNYSSPEDTFSGATLPDAIADWAGSVGSKIIYKSETSFLSSWPIEQVVWLNNYISPDFHVAVLINHGLISDSWNITPTHWIMWTGKLIDIQSNNPVNKKTSENTLVDLEVFSWGNIFCISQYGKKHTLRDFCKYIYGAVIFKKIT
ncbi:hypothetical protein D782_1999 [Enterobacteriaceae bacterium strain FGI 57]|nr:hypothetical protein D782_1999 [Enterobacteriaceae bacterium strain FGI 57]